MPIVSVVIVNYNVKYFIKQCIQSLLQSDIYSDIEIIVVDNNSKDGSVEMIRQLYPEVNLITNSVNKGFSKANNQGFKEARGRYVLILNPDTLVEEDTISKCLDHIEKDSSIGAIGVKMIDGAGKFLPESKRGFPTPANSFFKLSGIGRLFQKSKIFNSYYQGHLANDNIHDIEVLTGAFVFAQKKVLVQIGGFDEEYFMYGEDIELSYQIQKAGFKLVYLPTTQIIHFKGESTNKNSIDYIRNFYGAMRKYALKRNNTGSDIWNLVIQFGILASAITGFFKNILAPVLRPVIDIIVLFSIARLIQYLWARYYFSDPDYYLNSSSHVTVFALSAVMGFCYYLFGQYDKRHNIKHLMYGFVFGSLLMLSVYSLLPNELRFSRIVLLILAILSPVLLYITRKVFNKLLYGSYRFDGVARKRIAVVGSRSSYLEISKIIESYTEKTDDQGYIDDNDNSESIGTRDEIMSIVESKKIDELIFCSKDLSAQFIFSIMSKLGNQISFKIANDDNTSILGSDSRNRVGQWYTLDISFKIDQVFHRRTKRLLDLLVSILAMILGSFFILFSSRMVRIGKNIPSVIMGSKTWVGYILSDMLLDDLPELKKSVFELPVSSVSGESLQDQIHQVNLYYARNYSIWLELAYLYKVFFN